MAGTTENALGQRTLLFVGAHPDDETLGPGGTLAHYVASGVNVYYACATRGEAGTVSAESMQRYTSVGDLRWAEMTCAAQVLGLAGVRHLGYRDSGMPGSPDNKRPDALFAAPLEEVAGRIVAIIRELRPQVVLTFDPIGGYRHPDHIVTHRATVMAFHAAGDPARYPDAGPPFQPRKLYFSVFPRGMLKVAVRLLPLFGQDPHHLGKNKDVDIASLVEVEFPIHARIRLNRHAISARERATACHASQVDSAPRAGLPRLIATLLSRFQGRRDLFMRAYPPVSSRHPESDLFAGLG